MGDYLEPVSPLSRSHPLEPRKDPMPLGRVWFLHPHPCLKPIALRVGCTGYGDCDYGWRIMNLKEPKGLYVRGITSYPTYIKGQLVAFNLCKFSRSAMNKTFLAQFPTPSAATRFEDPRESAPQALKRQGHRVSKSKGMPLDSAHSPCK